VAHEFRLQTDDTQSVVDASGAVGHDVTVMSAGNAIRYDTMNPRVLERIAVWGAGGTGDVVADTFERANGVEV
jgi:hypothetical protein